MSTDCHHTKWRRNITENFSHLSRVNERYRQTDDRQTDGRDIAKNSIGLRNNRSTL